MKPRTRSLIENWGLVIAALLALVVVIGTRHQWTSGELAARANHLVVGFRPADVDRFTVTEGARRVVVEREKTAGEVVPAGNTANASDEVDPLSDESVARAGSHVEQAARWVVREPYQGDAEEASVDALLRGVEFATVLREVPAASLDRKAAGLDDPVRTIELQSRDVKTRLRFGALAPTPPGAQYVEVAGEGTANKGVYVVSKTTASELTATPSAFRIRQLVPYSASKLKRVQLSSPEQGNATFEYREQDGQGTWLVSTKERPLRVTHAVWERLFTAFARSQAELFLDADAAAAPAPLTVGQVEVALQPRDERQPEARLRFGGPCPTDSQLELAIRLAPDPVRACVKPLFLGSFLSEPDSFVDRGLFSYRADEVEQWSVTQGDQVLDLARREDGWAMRSPHSGAVEREVGNARLDAILDLRGELTEPATTPELLRTVSLKTSGETEAKVQEERVELYRVAQRGVVAHRLEDDAWLAVGESAERLLAPDALLLKATQLVEIDAKQVAHFELTTEQWTQQVNVTDGAKECHFQPPAEGVVDSALCMDVIDGLRTLRAQTWVASGDDGSFGLEKPTVRAQLTSSTGSKWTLEVGALAAGGGHYARLGTDPAVFTVKRSLVDTLTTLLLDRSAFTLDPDKITEVVLSTPERTVALRRLGQDFIVKPSTSQRGAQVPLSPGQIETVLDALSLLRAEAAVTWQEPSAEPRYGFDRPLLKVQVDQKLSWMVGAGDVYRNVSIYYATLSGAENRAVFALPRQSVQRILDLL